MKKTIKKIAAMAAAVMMTVSISSIGASAALDNSFSLYISSTGSKTYKNCQAGTSSRNNKISTTVTLTHVSYKAGITYKTYVDNILVGTTPRTTSMGAHVKNYDNDKIKANKPIKIRVDIAPSPAGIGSEAAGHVSGS